VSARGLPAESETSIKIGFTDPLSQAFANFSAHRRRELQLLIEDINQRPCYGAAGKKEGRHSARPFQLQRAPTCAPLLREERCNEFLRNLHAICESAEKTAD
jgi:hypothetical protein